ncbi:MAG: hypothetical protein ABID79_04905 [Elusimicrobiota bacterium]
MKNIKNTFLFIVPVLLVISLAGCDYWKTLTRGGEGAFIIEGTKTISGQTIEFKPGTTVKLKTKKTSTIGGVVPTYGELVLTNGARLIARGTPTNPIIFETSESYPGGIIFNSDSDGANSVIEYCEFKTNISISCNNSISIQYCKFGRNLIGSVINQDSGNLTVKNCTFGGANTSVIYCGGQGTSALSTLIEYCDIKNGYYGITSFGSLSIKNSNITNCTKYAIGSLASAIAESNYVANCNGKQGVDTTGEQSDGILYTNPQTSPITNAGCGW